MQVFKGERGEAQLSGAAIGVIIWMSVAVLVVGALYFFFQASAGVRQHFVAAGTAEGLVDRMHEECASALACRVPALDPLGKSNADGHFIAFFTRTTCDPNTNPCGPQGRGEDLFWGYDFDAAKSQVQEYTWRWNGTGFTTPVVKGAPWTDITAFSGTEVTATERADPASAFYNPIVAAIPGLKDIDCSYGFTDFHGWNGTVDVNVQAGPKGKDGTFPDALGQPNVYCAESRTYIVGHFTPTPDPDPSIWPNALKMPVAGSTLVPGATCDAQPYTDNGFDVISTPPPWLAAEVSLSANNCYNGRVWMHDPGWSGNFALAAASTNTCVGSGYLTAGSWNGASPTAGLLFGANGKKTPVGTPCTISLQGDPDAANAGVLTSIAEVVDVTSSTQFVVKSSTICNYISPSDPAKGLDCTGNGTVTGPGAACSATFVEKFGDIDGNNLGQPGPGANATVAEPSGNDAASWSAAMLSAAQGAVAAGSAGTGWQNATAGQPGALLTAITSSC